MKEGSRSRLPNRACTAELHEVSWVDPYVCEGRRVRSWPVLSFSGTDNKHTGWVVPSDLFILIRRLFRRRIWTAVDRHEFLPPQNAFYLVQEGYFLQYRLYSVHD